MSLLYCVLLFEEFVFYAIYALKMPENNRLNFGFYCLHVLIHNNIYIHIHIYLLLLLLFLHICTEFIAN